jgi:hypothetical protein
MSLWTDLSARGRNLVLHELERVFDPNTGRFLSQLLYWYSPDSKHDTRATVQYDGRSWVARTKEQWIIDTNMSEWRIRVAMERLLELGLIERQILPYHNQQVRHLWLNVPALVEFIAQNDAREELSQEQGECEFLTTPVSVPHALYKYKELEESFTVTAPGQAPGTNTHTLADLSQGQENTTMNINDVLANKKIAAPVANVTPSVLALFWKKRQAEYIGGYVKDLTGKQLGQLKFLLKGVGPERSLAVINFVFENWARFALQVKSDKGLLTVPAAPDIGFLTAYHDIAVQLIAEKQPTSPVSAKPVIIPVTPKLEKNPEPAEVEKKMSYEEMMGYVASVKAGKE